MIKNKTAGYHFQNLYWNLQTSIGQMCTSKDCEDYALCADSHCHLNILPLTTWRKVCNNVTNLLTITVVVIICQLAIIQHVNGNHSLWCKVILASCSMILMALNGQSLHARPAKGIWLVTVSNTVANIWAFSRWCNVTRIQSLVVQWSKLWILVFCDKLGIDAIFRVSLIYCIGRGGTKGSHMCIGFHIHR